MWVEENLEFSLGSMGDQWVIKYIQKYLRQQNLLLELCNKNQTKSLIPAFN